MLNRQMTNDKYKSGLTFFLSINYLFVCLSGGIAIKKRHSIFYGLEVVARGSETAASLVYNRCTRAAGTGTLVI